MKRASLNLSSNNYENNAGSIPPLKSNYLGMNIVKRFKGYNLLMFILFEVIVFALFIIVNNKFISIASGPGILVTVMFLLVLAFGVAMFVMVQLKDNPVCHDMDKTDSVNSTQQKDNTLTNINKNSVTPEEKEIDLTDILPENIKDLGKYTERLLINISDVFKIVQGVLYLRKKGSNIFQCNALYAYYSDKKPSDFIIGETLPGQAIKNKKTVSLSKIPDNYFTIVSGLGKGSPRELVFLPLIFEDDVIGLIEYATFSKFNSGTEKALNKVGEKVAATLVNIYKV